MALQTANVMFDNLKVTPRRSRRRRAGPTLMGYLVDLTTFSSRRVRFVVLPAVVPRKGEEYIQHNQFFKQTLVANKQPVAVTYLNMAPASTAMSFIETSRS